MKNIKRKSTTKLRTKPKQSKRGTTKQRVITAKKTTLKPKQKEQIEEVVDMPNPKQNKQVEPTLSIGEVNEGAKQNKPQWANLSISQEDIVAETDTSSFIKLPNGSKLQSYGFWHPKKLIRTGSNGLKLAYHDKFTFKMMKYDEERNSKTGALPVLDVFKISAEKLMEYYAEMT